MIVLNNYLTKSKGMRKEVDTIIQSKKQYEANNTGHFLIINFFAQLCANKFQNLGKRDNFIKHITGMPKCLQKRKKT